GLRLCDAQVRGQVELQDGAGLVVLHPAAVAHGSATGNDNHLVLGESHRPSLSLYFHVLAGAAHLAIDLPLFNPPLPLRRVNGLTNFLETRGTESHAAACD